MGFKRWFKILILTTILNVLENSLLIGFLGVFTKRNFLMTLGFSIAMALIIEMFLKD